MTRDALLIAGGVVAVFYLLSQSSSSDTNADGSATDGTDAGWMEEAEVSLNLVPDFVNAWADAITQHEGWYPGSRSYRNNNPGNLEVDGDLGRDSGGYGVFSSYNRGRNALVADLMAKVRKYSSWTLYQVMARYAPPKENNTQAYTDIVARALGVTSTTRAGDIAGAWASAGRSWSPVAFSSQPASTGSLTGDLNIAATVTSYDDLIDLSTVDTSGDA